MATGNLAAQMRSNLIQKATKKSWDENPLETIGLTPRILDMGIEDEQLHTFCIKTARNWVDIFHPDRVENEGLPEELIRKYSDAFDLIKEPLIFREALREFKQIKNEEQSNNNDLNRQLTKTRNELRLANEKIAGYKAVKQLIKPVNERPNALKKATAEEPKTIEVIPNFAVRVLEDFRKSQGVFVGFKDPISKRNELRDRTVITRSIEAAKYVLAIRLKIEHSNTPPNLGQLPHIRSLYKRGFNLHQKPNKDETASIPTLADLLREAKLEFGRANLEVADLGDILKKVKPQSSHFPRIKWGLLEAYHHYGFNYFGRTSDTTPIIPNFLAENPDFDRKFIIERFYQGLHDIQKRLLKPVWITGLDLYPVILKLEHGFYSEAKGGRYTGHEPTEKVSRVIGSFLPKSELITEAMRNSGEISESMVRKDVHPLLQKGSFLVKVNKTHILLKGKTPEQQLMGYYNRLKAMTRYFYAEYFILELK